MAGAVRTGKGGGVVVSWSASAMFGAFLYQPLLAGGATGYSSLTVDTIDVALYNNTGTPDKTVAASLSGYNTGQWVTANEVIDTGGSNWPAGGLSLAGKTVSSISGGVKFDANDLPSLGAVTLSNVYGALVYDSTITAGTVAKQGVAFLYGGGAASVTAGSFTVVFNASGLINLTA